MNIEMFTGVLKRWKFALYGIRMVSISEITLNGDFCVHDNGILKDR